MAYGSKNASSWRPIIRKVITLDYVYAGHEKRSMHMAAKQDYECTV